MVQYGEDKTERIFYAIAKKVDLAKSIKLNYEAQTKLLKLLEKVELGIIIANCGIPKAILSRYVSEDHLTQDSPLDRYAGQIEISDDFDDEDLEINQLFGV